MDLALNNQQGLICLKTKPNQTKPFSKSNEHIAYPIKFILYKIKNIFIKFHVSSISVLSYGTLEKLSEFV